jgi:chromosome segregation ATPase
MWWTRSDEFKIEAINDEEEYDLLDEFFSDLRDRELLVNFYEFKREYSEDSTKTDRESTKDSDLREYSPEWIADQIRKFREIVKTESKLEDYTGSIGRIKFEIIFRSLIQLDNNAYGSEKPDSLRGYSKEHIRKLEEKISTVQDKIKLQKNKENELQHKLEEKKNELHRLENELHRLELQREHIRKLEEKISTVQLEMQGSLKEKNKENELQHKLEEKKKELHRLELQKAEYTIIVPLKNDLNLIWEHSSIDEKNMHWRM